MKKSALFASGVLCLLMASFAASASAVEYHSSAASASLSGSQSGTGVITLEGSSLTCSIVNLTGTSSATKTSVEQDLHPTFSGCTAFGFAGATVNSAGCNLEFNANTTNVNLEDCTLGGITIHVSAFFDTTTCHVFIKNQSGLNNWVWPTGKSTDTEAKISAGNNNLEYKVLASDWFCPLTEGAEDDDGSAVYQFGLKANAGAATLWKE